MLASACQRESAAEGAAREQLVLAAVPPPTIELAGCRHIEPGTCHLDEGSDATLQVWVDIQAKAELRVSVDGTRLETQSLAVDGGQRFALPVAATAGAVQIEGIEPPWTAPFELTLVREPIVAELARAEQLSRGGDPRQAIEMLGAALEGGALAPTQQLAVLQRLRRLLGGVDPDQALVRTEQAATLARSIGRTRDLADCAAAAAALRMQNGDLAGAHEWVETLEHAGAKLPEARVWGDYYGGVLAALTGDLGGSVRALEEARRGAERLGMFRTTLAASEQLATSLAQLGRGDEALEVARDVEASAAAPGVSCKDRARAQGNVGWIHLLLAEAGLPHDPPRELMEAQLAAVDAAGRCPDPYNAARVNLALVALAEHEPEEAWAWISEAIVAGVPTYLQPWVAEIEAQIGVATGREQLIPPLVGRPEIGEGEPGLRWIATVRHARTLEAYGLREAAIDSLEVAELLLEDTLTSVGVDPGRELFLFGKRASAEGLVDLLIQTGRVDEAFCRARLARGRTLRTIDRAARIASLSPSQRADREDLLFRFVAARDQLAAERREDWQFSAPERERRESRRAARMTEAMALLDLALGIVADQREPPGCETLPPIRPDELTLMQFPAGGGGSWVFVADSEGVSVAAAADPPVDGHTDHAWAEQVLAPISARLRAAKQIRVIPTGAGWGLAFHALAFEDGVLLHAAPIVYALDLSTRPHTGPSAVEPARAVVVANPSNDLPQAQSEAIEVERGLLARGFEVEHFNGAAATGPALSQSLPGAALLHYAGHGTHGGPGGWEAALVLHDSDQLSVIDILALPRVPAAVVLSGCDTATVDDQTLAGGMNLGRAFVLAGARWVLAADGKVDDALAREIGVSLYEQATGAAARLAPPEQLDGAAALRDTQLRLRSEGVPGWQAFRVVVP
ncbi:hypothetical protein DB30_00702 [Enhygromyxa salina]|uniref:CHAT domain-containing protein n=1 Tax=Enhygromyxa salina TaxID=215803 RepID=A0A0C2DFL5_9BACT|nr:CHAT domain-containing protein [Enhygromyxa salina]KIG18417.1 hypothetical protein DB30_00702 [Enhygromyxa salina]